VTHSGPEVLFKTCVAMKFVDDDDDDDTEVHLYDFPVNCWYWQTDDLYKGWDFNDNTEHT